MNNFEQTSILLKFKLNVNIYSMNPDGAKVGFEDKKLVCRDCGVQFVWTAGEQDFFSSKGFTNVPSRCPECRKKNRSGKKDDRRTTVSNNKPTETFDIKCKECAKVSSANFKPKNPANLLCAECFEKQLKN